MSEPVVPGVKLMRGNRPSVFVAAPRVEVAVGDDVRAGAALLEPNVVEIQNRVAVLRVHQRAQTEAPEAKTCSDHPAMNLGFGSPMIVRSAAVIAPSGPMSFPVTGSILPAMSSNLASPGFQLVPVSGFTAAVYAAAVAESRRIPSAWYP